MRHHCAARILIALALLLTSTGIAHAASLQGVVIDLDSGRNVPNVRVGLTLDQNGQIRQVAASQTDASGAFRFDNLIEGGDYQVAAATSDYMNGIRLGKDSLRPGAAFGTNGTRVHPHGVTPVRVTVFQLGLVGGTVRLPPGGASADLHVGIFYPDRPGQFAIASEVQPNGRYSLSQHVGTYLVGVLAWRRTGVWSADEGKKVWYYPGTWDPRQAKRFNLTFRRPLRVDLTVPAGRVPRIP